MNREGIDMAAGEYGVEDEVASLIDLAIQLRKHNLSPAEAKAGVIWSLQEPKQTSKTMN